MLSEIGYYRNLKDHLQDTDFFKTDRPLVSLNRRQKNNLEIVATVASPKLSSAYADIILEDTVVSEIKARQIKAIDDWVDAISRSHPLSDTFKFKDISNTRADLKTTVDNSPELKPVYLHTLAMEAMAAKSGALYLSQKSKTWTARFYAGALGGCASTIGGLTASIITPTLAEASLGFTFLGFFTIVASVFFMEKSTLYGGQRFKLEKSYQDILAELRTELLKETTP